MSRLLHLELYLYCYPSKMSVIQGQLPKVCIPMFGVADGGMCGRHSYSIRSRPSNKIMCTPPPHISSSEEIVPVSLVTPLPNKEQLNHPFSMAIGNFGGQWKAFQWSPTGRVEIKLTTLWL